MGSSQSKQKKLKKFIANQATKEMDLAQSASLNKTRSRKPIKPRLQNAQKISFDAKPSEEIIERVINNPDLRKQVLRTDEWPHSVHGVVSMSFPKEKLPCWGTGTLIGPNIVLTAGHNLYDFKKKVYAKLKSLQFLPGMNGQLLPFGFTTVKKYFVSPDYIKEGREDYGILILKESIGDMTGYFGLACLKSEEIKKKKINITGYPGDKVKQKPKMFEMWGMEGSVSDIDTVQGHIHYMIDTYGGQSGSGIWYKEGNDFIVCGVHVLGCGIVNKGTLLTRRNYQQIHSWINQATLKEELSLVICDGTILWDLEYLSFLTKFSLAKLTTLLFRGWRMNERHTKVLAQNTSWINLKVLDLAKSNIGEEGARELAQNTSWINLSELNLSWNHIGAEGAKALSLNTSWTNLSKLNLEFNSIWTEGAKALALNTSWVKLLELDLSRNTIHAEGAKALAQNTFWINLSKLNLSHNIIEAEGTQALAQNISWINLSELDLKGSCIGEEGAKALAKNTSWINLSELDLSGNCIVAEGAKALAKNTSWINLSKLNLSGNYIAAEGAKALAQNISWINLSKLNLCNNKIGAEGAQALAQNISWINLSELDLSYNNIRDEGTQALAQNTSWINLSKLDLSRNHIQIEGAQALAQNTSWTELEVLKLMEIDEKRSRSYRPKIIWKSESKEALYSLCTL